MRVLGGVFLIALNLSVGSSVSAQQPLRLTAPRLTPASVPMPRPRPVEAGPRVEAKPAAEQPVAASEPPPPSDCFMELSSGVAEVKQLPPITEANGCEAADVVQLDAVLTLDRRRIPLSPPAVLRCSMASALASWVREDLPALAAAQGGLLSGLDNFNSFECRGRNRVVGAKISEHGRGNALDIRAVLINGNRKLELTNPEVARPFREAMRMSVCRRFTTVLGPGSDGYHEDHIHIDLAERRNGYRICQWDVRDPQAPLPRERPAEADAAEKAADKKP